MRRKAYLFYLLILKDYKKNLFRTCISLIGIVLSLALLSSVFIFTSTIEHHLNKTDPLLKAYPNTYISHSSGLINKKNLQQLIQSKTITYAYPFKQFKTQLNIDTHLKLVDVIALDFIYAGLDQNHLSTLNLPSLSLDTAIFISDNKTLLNNTKPNIKFFEKELQIQHVYSKQAKVATLIMDISLLDSLVKDLHIDRLYLDNSQVERFKQSQQRDFYLVSNTQQKSALSKAFFINLELIGLFTMLVSTLIALLFFCFIEKKRQFSYKVLSHLGINQSDFRDLRVFEALFFIITTSSFGLLLGYLISFYSIHLISNVLNTLYYSVDLRSVYIDQIVVVKVFALSSLAILLAKSPVLIRLSKKNSLNIKTTLFFSLSLLLSLAFIVSQNDSRFAIYASIIALFMMILSLSSLLNIGFIRYFSSIKDARLFIFKSTAFNIRENFIFSNLTIVAIALACGLFISIAIFLTSFESAVTQWITFSTKSDLYIQSKNNTIPQAINLPNDDILAISQYPDIQNLRSIKRLNIMLNQKPFILRSLDFDDLSKQLLFKNLDKIENKAAYISEAAAKRLNKNIGDTLLIPTPFLNYSTTIQGIYVDYASEKGVITISNDLMTQLYGSQVGTSGLALNLKASYRTDFVNSFSHLLIQSKEQLQGYVLSMFEDTFTFTWLLAFLCALIALFVLLNALAVIAKDRHLELQQLFSMGAAKKQLESLIFSHIFWIGSLSVMLSVLVGFSLAYIILYKVIPYFFAWQIPFLFSLKPILLWLCPMLLIMIILAYIAFKLIWKNLKGSKQLYEALKLYFSS